MNLYTVTFKADCNYGKDIKSEHEVILTANDKGDAEEKAKRYFLQFGGWTSAAGLQEGTGQPPNIRQPNVALRPSIVVCNGKLVREAEQVVGEAATTDYGNVNALRKLVKNLSSQELKRRCKEDPAFREAVDNLSR